MSSDDEGQGAFFQVNTNNNNYDIYSQQQDEDEEEQFQTVITKNLGGPKRVAPGHHHSSLGTDQNLLKTYLDQAGGAPLGGEEAGGLFHKTRDSKSSDSQWSQQQDDNLDGKPQQRGRGRGRGRGGAAMKMPNEPQPKMSALRGRGRKPAEMGGGAAGGGQSENQLPKKRGRKAKDQQQPSSQVKKPNETERYIIQPPIVLKPSNPGMQSMNFNRPMENIKPSNFPTPMQKDHEPFEDGDQSFDILRTSSQDEFMTAPLATDPFAHQLTPQPSRTLAPPPAKTFQPPPSFQQVQKKPQPPQVSLEMQQRQQNIAEIAAKALDEVEQVEKMIEEKLKTQILMRFKKAVKSILQGLVEEFEKPPNDKNDETIDASLQALQFVQCEISKIHSRVNDIVQYKIPSGNDFTPTMNLTAKTLMIRDEVNLPLEDFAGTVLTPQTLPSQSMNMVTLNRDLYECSFDKNSNRVKFSQLLQLKTQPRFFFAHQGNICFDSGIYVNIRETESGDQRFSDDDNNYGERFEKSADFTNVLGGAPLTQDCIILSHQSKSEEGPFLSLMRWDSSKRKYETTCHLTHSEQPLQLLRTFEHEGSLQVVATTNNSIFRYTFTEDPCIYRDSHIDLIEVFKSEAYTKIIDLAIFNNTQLAVLTQTQLVLLIKNIVSESPEVVMRHQLPNDASRDQLMMFSYQMHPSPSILVNDSKDGQNFHKILDLQTGSSSVVKSQDDPKQATDDQKQTLKVLQILPPFTAGSDNKKSGYLLANKMKHSMFQDSHQLVALSFSKL